MAAVMEYVVGALTAVCTSLVVVLMLWRLSRRFSLRASPPPCCDVTDLLAWLLDASHALMGAAILVLVVSDDVTCAVAGFLALLGGAQTLCLLATRAVVLTTGHVVRGGSRDVEVKATRDEVDDKVRCTSVPLIVVLVCVVTVFCALPLSQLPIATARQHNHSAHHLTCLPLTLESRDSAAWRYSCFLLVAVCWLPLVVAVMSAVVDQCRRVHCSPWLCSVSVLTLTTWSVVIVLVSVELLATPLDYGRRAVVETTVSMMVDVATLMHVLEHVLRARHRHVNQTHQHHHHHHHHQQLPARLTAVTRAPQQLVRS